MSDDNVVASHVPLFLDCFHPFLALVELSHQNMEKGVFVI